jgi:predicted ATPase/transcriptional regulator with XRE-family HTH domain
MAEPLSFGSWLKRRRKALDLTQAALGRRVGCSEAAIRKIEAEVRRPSVQLASRLADLLGVPTGEKSAFLRFARGDWQSAPDAGVADLSWRDQGATGHARLPATSTSLIGREEGIAAVGALLSDENVRLVTLVGPPGIGKTRLSIEVARSARADFPDGVVFVALAPLQDSALIAATVTQSLGYVGAKAQSSQQQLLATLRDQRLLLVLDNCEHLVEAVALLVADILSATSHVKVLATSRESLRLSGEWLFPVPGLAVPTDSKSVTLESTEQYPALKLFGERARAVRPDFRIDATNVSSVATLCVQLDGLPLAIELIAARIRSMPPQLLSDRLNEPTALLAGSRRAVVARQRSLGDSIRWSYDLLAPDEQDLFARLSVFAGTFSLDMAESVFDQIVTNRPVSELLTSLQDKSLLQRSIDDKDAVRFSLLGTVRHFAADQLRRSQRAQETRGWHLAYCLDLAEVGDKAIRGPRQLEWLQRLGSLRDDFRGALEWAIESQQIEAALQLACRLDWFWFVRSDHTEGRHWLRRVLALPDATRYPQAYAQALTQLAHHAWLQTGPGEARRPVEQALDIARAHTDRQNSARALTIVGLVLRSEGQFAAARSALTESQALFRELNDAWGYAHALICLATQSYVEGDRLAAVELYVQALALFHGLGDRYFETVALHFIGRLHGEQGDVQRGQAALRQALLLAQQLHSKYEIAMVLWSSAGIAQAQGDPARAVRWCWAARNIYESIGAWGSKDEPRLAHDLAAARAVLDEETFAKAVAAGRAMTIEEAITDVLATLNE